MEDRRRQNAQSDVDASGETNKTKGAHESKLTNSEVRDRTLELLTNHDAKLRELAEYLHDEIGQLLVSTSMHLHSSLKPASHSPNLTTCLTIVQQAIERLRDLTRQLHPSILEHLSLPESIRCSLSDREHRDGVEIELFAPTHWVPALPPIEVTCYRAVVQLVEHAVFHRSSDRVRVDMRQDAEMIEVTIYDLDSTSGSESFRSCHDCSRCDGWRESRRRIEWLGGDWQIESTVDQGESVHIHLPITVDAGTIESGDDSREPR